MVEAINKHVDPRFVDLGSFRDQTIVRVSVSDIDEPPIFQPAEGTIMQVQEDAKAGALVGIVSARDPDEMKKAVRYKQSMTMPLSARVHDTYNGNRSGKKKVTAINKQQCFKWDGLYEVKVRIQYFAWYSTTVMW